MSNNFFFYLSESLVLLDVHTFVGISLASSGLLAIPPHDLGGLASRPDEASDMPTKVCTSSNYRL